ncbi:MAG: Deoxyguanosinetriphosphate triphosphohydrolase-like protein [Verrucomicrobia subdivision 3 bacterium]|nr:Deoxyguanosinetriphosphate triphosphohydrolase-like protein [Limisphaerales bacterium]MCS1416673.1 Deoxyguanosinetriphosphate triphosphohydrolase-like protein [Limisphaerales bacterium]
MSFSIAELEAREAELLAPFAQKSRDSQGRRHKEPEEGWRTRYQRDRDRIIHSRAFRRLEYKTQVFLNGTGDHLRTRLTHTIEVAAISHNIARALNLNEDLTEAISLAHDLGHAPFGHKGEDALNEIMADAGGFEHNRQSLRVVEFLEQKYPEFPGLNLSWEIREGLAKHQTTYDSSETMPSFEFASPCLEAQISNLADEVAYYSHDLDDGLESGLLSEEQLMKSVEIWAQAAHQARKTYPQAKKESRRYFIIRCIIDREVKDVVNTTEKNLADSKVQSADEVRRLSEPLVCYSDKLTRTNRELRDYLYHNLYYHPEVHQPNLRAVRNLKGLFNFYLNHPDQIGSQARLRSEADGLKRGVCDYIAGMTDRYVLAQVSELGLSSDTG